MRLHGWLRAAWPCPERGVVDTLLHDIAAELQTQGLRMGRQTYDKYSDAELSMARAAWCTVPHQRPSVVVETGVARGVTSRIVLEALNRNERGHLWSIDLPHPLKKDLHAQIGAAFLVHTEHAGRMSRAPAEGGYPRCFARSHRSIFLFTTVCIPPAIRDSRWSRRCAS